MRNPTRTAAAALVLVLIGGFGLAVVCRLSATGVTLTVWVDKLLWKAEELVVLKADLSHRGEHELERVGGFHLEVNGTWYVRFEKEIDTREHPRVFRRATDYRTMEFALDARWASREFGDRLRLEPGRHRVRLAFVARAAETDSEETTSVSSDVAEFRIEEPGVAATEEEWFELAAGGEVGARYSAEEAAARYREAHGYELDSAELADYYWKKTFELAQRGPEHVDMRLLSPLERADLRAATRRTRRAVAARMLVEAAECAAAFEHSDLATLRLYTYLGDAYVMQSKKHTAALWGRQRRVAAMAYVKGLRYSLGCDLPLVKPERSGVFMYRHQGQELGGSHLLRVARAIAGEADRIRELVDARQVLAGQLVGMYAREPEADQELFGLVAKGTGSERIAELLVEAVKARRKDDRAPVPPLMIARADERGYEEGRHVTIQAGEFGVLEVGFVCDKREVMVGEPLFLTFHIKNTGEEPCRIQLEGYRLFRRFPLSASPSRFRIAAVNENGEAVKAPASLESRRGEEFGRRAGAFGDGVTLGVDAMYAERLFLGHWCTFEDAGLYTVTCTAKLRGANEDGTSSPLPATVNVALRVKPYDQTAMRDVIAGIGEQVARGEYLHEGSLALSMIDSEEVVPYLAAVLRREDTWQGKRLAIRGLSRYATEASVSALVDALTAKNKDDFTAAAEALRTMGKAEAVVDELSQWLASGDADARAAAVRALGSIGSERAFEAIVSALDDTSNDVRYAALEALGRLRRPDCVDVLNRYVNDEDLHARFVAVKALAAHTKTIEPAWLLPIIKTSGLNDRRFHESIHVIRFYGKDQAAAALISCLDFEDPSPRNQRNFFLIMGIESCPGGPKYSSRYFHDANTDGTPEQVEGNRQVLKELKTWLSERE